MLKKIILKKKVDIDDASYIYNLFSRHSEIKKYKFLNKISDKPYLLLSNIFERNIFNNENRQLDSMFFIGLKNLILTKRLSIILTNKQRSAYYFGRYIKDRCLNNKLFLKLVKKIIFFIFKFLKSLIDIFCLIFLILIIGIFKKSKTINACKEIYTLTFSWTIANSNDPISYLYPDFYKRKSKSAFVTDFDNYRFIFKGLLDTYFNENLQSPLDFIFPKDILRSLINLFKINFFEILNPSLYKYGSTISFLNSLKNINRRFFALLVLESTTHIMKEIDPTIIFIWGEGHLADKAFTIGLTNYVKKNNLKKVKIYSYIGTPISKHYYPHYLPTRFDISSGIWSSNILVFDESSLKEMTSFTEFKNINSNVKVIRKTMTRSIEKNYKKHLTKPKRFLTLFCHGSYDELSIILFNFYKYIYLNDFYNNNKHKVFIRLHPLLKKEDLISQINKFENLLKFKFPDFVPLRNNSEDIHYSIRNTKYCIFGESTYINYAIENDVKVFYVRTSYLFNSPINSYLINKKNVNELTNQSIKSIIIN